VIGAIAQPLSTSSALMTSWLALLVVGLIMVASASVALDGAYLTKHLIFLALSLIAFAIMCAVPLVVWSKLYLVAWAGAFLLAVLVLFVGHEVNGATRWIRLGSFSLQPSEVAKLCLMVYLAGYLSRYHERLKEEPGRILLPLSMVLAVAGLLVGQPDLGSAVVIVGAAVALFFLAGARLSYFVGFICVGTAALGLLIWLEPYRMERLITFLDPWPKAFDSGYQLTQALIAFGRGEWFGLGLGEGIQKLFYLPEAHNDFIFAVIAEELGIVGTLAIAGLFAYFVSKLFALASQLLKGGSLFAGFGCYFAGLIVGLQFLVNLGVNTGVLPTKGLTLPFVSFGGNSLIVSCAMFGFAMRAIVEEARDG
jgi:cell division protein FtsW